MYRDVRIKISNTWKRITYKLKSCRGLKQFSLKSSVCQVDVPEAPRSAPQQAGDHPEVSPSLISLPVDYFLLRRRKQWKRVSLDDGQPKTLAESDPITTRSSPKTMMSDIVNPHLKCFELKVVSLLYTTLCPLLVVSLVYLLTPSFSL